MLAGPGRRRSSRAACVIWSDGASPPAFEPASKGDELTGTHLSTSGAEAAGRGDRDPDLATLAQTFGREAVATGERQARVRRTFERIAAGYDRANDLMSMGLHRRWKARLAGLCVEDGPVLDLASGTGDVAARLRRHGRFVVGVDASPAMLAVDRARHPAAAAVAGAAEALPLADGGVAAVTLAFGLRNFTDPQLGLGEVRRVLRPGGRLYLLEFSRPIAAVRPFYRWGSARLLPWVGGRVTGAPDAYRYLVESIDRFPSAAAVAATLESTGLVVERIERLALGIAAIHVARRPDEGA